MSALSTSDALLPFTREWRPAGRPRGAFLLLHGMESHSGWFVEFASRLVGMGWAVTAFDRSGWGLSTGRRGHLESYRDFVEETCGFASDLRERYGSLHLAGMSWGGMATLYLGLRRSWLFDSLTLLAPGLAAKKDLPFTDKLRMAVDFVRGDRNRPLTPVFHPSHFTGIPRWQRFIADDPDRVRQVSVSFCLETLKMRRFIAETGGKRRLPPALCLLAGDDAIIDNRRSADICQRSGAEVRIIDGAAHSLVFDREAEVATLMSDHAEQAARERQNGHGRVWVVGGGAVGGAVATLLACGGVDTGLLVKEKHLDSLARRGFRLRTGLAVRKAPEKLVIAADPKQLPADPALAIIAVKSFDTGDTLAGLKNSLPATAILASLQNGLGNEKILASAFPQHQVIAGSICASLELCGPGEVLWADDRGGIGAAAFRGDNEEMKKIWLALLPHTGMECRWWDQPEAAVSLKWSKLMLNIGFNALNSVTGLTSAELLQDSRYGFLAIRALREGFVVMKRLGVEPFDLPGFPVSKLYFVTRMPLGLAQKLMAWQAGRSSEAAFSMRQDILQKRQHTEISDLNGAIVAHGQQLGIRTPANEELIRLVKNLDKDS